jgi:hypothetical protein
MGFCAMDSSSLAEKKKGKWSKGPQNQGHGRSIVVSTYLPSSYLSWGRGLL